MRQPFEFVVGIDYDNTAAGGTDDLPDELAALQRAVSAAVETHVTRSMRGTVRVWVIEAKAPTVSP